jgi:predicted dehydrogenase
LGCGSIGQRHIANLQALGCEVQGFDAFVAPGVRPVQCLTMSHWDAVVIATPWFAHLSYVRAAADNGTAFYVEKPLGTREQLYNWRELAGDVLPINMAGYQCRFHPKAKAMKALVPSPVGGDFHCVVDMANWPGQSYGPLELEASHDLDLAFWMGAPVNLAGQTDWRVSIENSPGNYCRSWSVFDDTSEARAVFDSPGELGDQMYVDAMAHFLECVREGKPTICPLADGLRVLEAVEAMACLSSR